MKKFFSEFKKFITRGNVVDMAVGVIVGGSFTAIVNGMSNFILKPIINWLLAIILGKDSLKDVYSFLSRAYDETGALDLANSIYIDWGSFINAVINFLLVAFVLFTIVKFVNRFRENRKSFAEKLEQGTLNRAERKEMRTMNLSPRKRADVSAYLTKKAQEEADARRDELYAAIPELYEMEINLLKKPGSVLRIGELDWLVLESKDSRVLLISCDVVCDRPFHKSNESVQWHDSDLRAWLNGAFAEAAFTPFLSSSINA